MVRSDGLIPSPRAPEPGYPPFRNDELWKLCKKFIKDNHISCGDAVYQRDAVAENALEFIIEVGKIVGYEEEDE